MDRQAKRSLDVITVKEPCSERWDRMPGDERVRGCGVCQRSVYNLSAMTADEADALISTREGRLCVRFIQRADGTVTTSDCAPDRLAIARRKARRALVWAGVMLGGFLTMVGASGIATAMGFDLLEVVEEPFEPEVMGEMPMELPPEPPPTVPEPSS